MRIKEDNAQTWTEMVQTLLHSGYKTGQDLIQYYIPALGIGQLPTSDNKDACCL